MTPRETRRGGSAVQSEGMETDRVGRLGRICKQVADEIDECRLEMERTRSQDRRQRQTVAECEEDRERLERTRRQGGLWLRVKKREKLDLRERTRLRQCGQE